MGLVETHLLAVQPGIPLCLGGDFMGQQPAAGGFRAGQAKYNVRRLESLTS